MSFVFSKVETQINDYLKNPIGKYELNIQTIFNFNNKNKK